MDVFESVFRPFEFLMPLGRSLKFKNTGISEEVLKHIYIMKKLVIQYYFYILDINLILISAIMAIQPPSFHSQGYSYQSQSILKAYAQLQDAAEQCTKDISDLFNITYLRPR